MQWKNNLNEVLNTINYHSEKKFKSMHQLMLSYFTRNVVFLPQQDIFFKFKINDSVRIELSPTARKNLSFKYSLNKGMVGSNDTFPPFFSFPPLSKFETNVCRTTQTTNTNGKQTATM